MMASTRGSVHLPLEKLRSSGIGGRLAGLAARRSFGCLGSLAGGVAGGLWGAVQGIVAPYDWDATGSQTFEFYGPGPDSQALDRFSDHAGNLFLWSLRLIGDILACAVVWSISGGLLALALCLFLRFALWFKRNFRVQ